MTNDKQVKGSRSFLGPLVLVALGIYFLLRNFGMLPDANWGILFELWPLWLIFIGLNIVVQQVPRPAGTLLSFLVGGTAVFAAFFLLFFSDDNAFLSRVGVKSNQEVIRETIAFNPEDINSAEVELDFGIMDGNVFALEPNEGLIEGDISYIGSLIFETTTDTNGGASVRLDTEHSSPWPWFPNSFILLREEDQWQIGLNPRTPLDLSIHSGTGALDLDFDQLNLANLRLDVGTGRVDLVLPDGEYQVDLDTGTGAAEVVFPDQGRVTARFDGGTGSFAIIIPEGIPAQISFDSGTGTIQVDERFTLIDGEPHGDSVWETADYNENGEGIELSIDVGTGNVRVDNPGK